MNTNHGEIFRAKINLETSKIAWKELQRFFAGGRALMASVDPDLVETVFQMSEDNAAQIQQWMMSGKLARVLDEQAREWAETDALVWAGSGQPVGAGATSGQVAPATRANRQCGLIYDKCLAQLPFSIRCLDGRPVKYSATWIPV